MKEGSTSPESIKMGLYGAIKNSIEEKISNLEIKLGIVKEYKLSSEPLDEVDQKILENKIPANSPRKKSFYKNSDSSAVSSDDLEGGRESIVISSDVEDSESITASSDDAKISLSSDLDDLKPPRYVSFARSSFCKFWWWIYSNCDCSFA